MKKWKCLQSKLALDSKYFKVRQDIVELPNGEKREWTYWDSPDSAMVVGMTEDKKLVMIKQYRYMVDDEVIEFPSGYNQSAETIEEGAKREFEEETGYTCNSLTKLGVFYETYGQLNRKIHLFFSKDISKLDQKNDSGDYVPEDIDVILVDYDRAVEMALKNKIVAMGSALAILLLKEKADKDEIKLSRVFLIMEKPIMKNEQGLLAERIESERLLLVPISMRYRDEIFREFSPEITTFMYEAPAKDISGIEVFIENSLKGLNEGSNLQLVIVAKDSQEFFGCAGLHHVDGKTPEMGVWIKKSAHGKGYGKEAMVAVKKWADENLDYDYLLYPVADKNISSRKIPESLGGKIETEYDEKGLGGNEYHCLEYRIYPERK
ncbi:MAG: acetyltransferase [Candidatus Magasanikbacteria bacterium GW2011_GWA2_56_11]|uniref:Acetyltransferase n=1 Tax=Candidatus Magasanikbacteria bacterium GW2011_GWA2_56_11 TaxID=1619044 RepID=A0A0G1YEV8_9BACT|nr:MAG: acetyltransferase [Candidatus Magasanikbacteria bacterium GW2011_GWA2_56_11]